MLRCFFFQAEAGIRDLYVTGVQTCALPIFAFLEKGAKGRDLVSQVLLADTFELALNDKEIGRASCRERVWRRVVRGCLEERGGQSGSARRAVQGRGGCSGNCEISGVDLLLC